MTALDLILAKTKAPLRVGPELTRGGEGAIHTLPDRSDRLLKLYLRPPSEEKLIKLRIMTSAANNALSNVAAWPIELVTDRQGRTRGFIMSRAASPTEAHELYTPKSRAQAFPEADFRFVLHVVANVVRAFGTVHQAGYVIGDVNHGQVLVGHDGKVTLIDCDSFQVQENGHLYTCDVGIPDFTPPELQGHAFVGLQRTSNHDCFGLAVLLFQMLFMGRHPYAGVPLGPAQSGDLGAAIAADRFAYGHDRQGRGVEQPPGTLPLTIYGPGISSLFERAFARQPAAPRPDEVAWLEQLKLLQNSLRACPTNPAHHYPSHLTSCPWCAIEARTGSRLFGTKLRPEAANQNVDIAALWHAILATPEPIPSPLPDLSNLKIAPRAMRDARLLKARWLRKGAALLIIILAMFLGAALRNIIAGFVVAGASGLLLWPRVPPEEVAAATKAAHTCQTTYDDLVQQWRQTVSSVPFANLKVQLVRAKTVLEGLPSERAARLAALTSEAKQREAYLDRFQLSREKVPGIGPGRVTRLRSFGIETAWDVTPARVMAVPGFGQGLASNLMAWRASRERGFRFNPNHPIAAAELRSIDLEINSKRQLHIDALRYGPSRLQAINSGILRNEERLKPEITTAWINLLAAKRRIRDLS